jgi:peptidoglycan hydrolase CwlO-like protein
LNSLEDSINDRNRQLNGASEQRREFDRIMNQFNEWIKNTEQQIKDHLANDLQQTANGLKERYQSIQVRTSLIIDSFTGKTTSKTYLGQSGPVRFE